MVLLIFLNNWVQTYSQMLVDHVLANGLVLVQKTKKKTLLSIRLTEILQNGLTVIQIPMLLLLLLN